MTAYQKVKQGISNESAFFNTYVAKGVPGMPLTHQTGFGEALKKGINPNDVNIYWMNIRTHVRMFAGVAGVVGGVAMIVKGNNAQKVIGAVVTVLGLFELNQLRQDWKMGFKAAKMLGPEYAQRMNENRMKLKYS